MKCEKCNDNGWYVVHGITETPTQFKCECTEPSKKQKLLDALNLLRNGCPEMNHEEADKLLIEYIGDEDIAVAYNAIHKWYA